MNAVEIEKLKMKYMNLKEKLAIKTEEADHAEWEHQEIKKKADEVIPFFVVLGTTRVPCRSSIYSPFPSRRDIVVSIPILR